jgi:hypothetical protein
MLPVLPGPSDDEAGSVAALADEAICVEVVAAGPGAAAAAVGLAAGCAVDASAWRMVGAAFGNFGDLESAIDSSSMLGAPVTGLPGAAGDALGTPTSTPIFPVRCQTDTSLG